MKKPNKEFYTYSTNQNPATGLWEWRVEKNLNCGSGCIIGLVEKGTAATEKEAEDIAFDKWADIEEAEQTPTIADIFRMFGDKACIIA